uniref:Uncharacterized protein n=1 Tax=Anopheles minimus TaxID=112268 RepID=A0A182W426_9DIPT
MTAAAKTEQPQKDPRAFPAAVDVVVQVPEPTHKFADLVVTGDTHGFAIMNLRKGQLERFPTQQPQPRRSPEEPCVVENAAVAAC